MNQQEKKKQHSFFYSEKKKKHIFLHFLKIKQQNKRFTGAWHKGLNVEKML